MADFFQDEPEIASSTSTTTSISTLYEPCPLCIGKAKSFTCESCIAEGNFSHSKKKYSNHSYCEMLARFDNLKRVKIAFQNRVIEILEKRRALVKLSDEVFTKKDRMRCLQQVLQNLQEDSKLDVLQLNSLREANAQKKTRLTNSQEKIKKLAELKNQYQAKLAEDKLLLHEIQKQLCEKRKISVNRIQQYLFPIKSFPVYPVMGTPPPPSQLPHKKSEVLDSAKDLEVDEDLADESLESALAEATRTSYIKGQWVSRDDEVRIEYSIVDDSCILNGNGDYSAYCNWVKGHRNGSRGPDEEIGLRNPAFTICAGLTHTAQFLEVLSYYFDVILPKRLSYSHICRITGGTLKFVVVTERHHYMFTGYYEFSHIFFSHEQQPYGPKYHCFEAIEFCLNELNKGEFKNAVRRLNGNILHLCFAQHVDPTLLHPDRTLHNLYALLNSASLGRGGPFECHPELLLTSSNQDDDEESDFESDVEEAANSESDAEWETLPKNLDFPDSPMESSIDNRTISGNIIDEPKEDNPAMASSLVSSAAASVAALWPWKR